MSSSPTPLAAGFLPPGESFARDSNLPQARRPSSAPIRADRAERVFAGFVAAASLAVLLVALWLTPSAAGHGTHEQLGLNPCVWALTLGQPCPTCGMTTAFAHASHGDLLSAFKAQPFGALLAIVTASSFWVSLHVALTGSTVGRVYAGLLGPRLMWLSMAALAGAWVYKITTWQGL